MVETIEHLRREGYAGLALNFATFRAVLAREAGDRFVHRVEKWFSSGMSDSMQIESLWTFNEKFQPEWHPRYASTTRRSTCSRRRSRSHAAESFWELPVIGRFFAAASAGDDEQRPRQLPVVDREPPPSPDAPASRESGA